MQWKQSRRSFLKACLLIVAAPFALMVVGQVGLVCGQMWVLLNLILLHHFAPEFYHTVVPDSTAEAWISNIGGAVVALCGCIVLLYYSWRRFSRGAARIK